MIRPIAAVVFDLDGTLLDTEGLFRTAFLRTARHFGMTVTDASYLRLVGVPTFRRCAQLAEELGRSLDVDAFCAAYRTEREAALACGVPVKPAARACLATLARLGVRLAVATSASRATALAHLDRAAMLAQLDEVVARDDVSRAKPAPDAFARAVRRLRCRAADTIAVEDSVPGLRAATDAGLRTVLIPDIAPLDARARRLAWRVEPCLSRIVALARESHAAEPALACAVAGT